MIGPIEGMSLVGNKWVLNQVDLGSSRMYVDVMKKKGDTTSNVKRQINEKQTQKNMKLKIVHSDGGREIVNKELGDFLASNGTVHTTTVPDTPQHNPCERGNRTLIENARSMLQFSGAPAYLGDEAIMCAAL